MTLPPDSLRSEFARSGHPEQRPSRIPSTIQNLAAFVLVLAIAALIAGAAMGWVNTHQLIGSDRWVAHTLEVIAQSEELLSTLKDAETRQRDYLVTGDESSLEPFELGLRHAQRVFGRLRELTADNPDQQARLAALAPLITRKSDELKEMVALAASGRRPQAVAMLRDPAGRATTNALRAQIGAIEQAERALLRQRERESQANARTTLLWLLVSASIGIGLVLLVSYLNRRAMRARQYAAEALDRQRNLLRVTLSSIGDAVITTDTSGNITSLNPVAESLTGWGSAEAAGQPLDLVFHIVNAQTGRQAENPALRALEASSAVNLADSTVLIAKDGTEHAIDDSAAPIRDASGAVHGAVLVFRDIADRKRAERMLVENKSQLEAELADTKLLQRISVELVEEHDVEALYERIVEAAVALMRSDFASMQSFDPKTSTLNLLAHRGFTPRAAEFWATVSLGDHGGTSCGEASNRGERVIVPDVETWDGAKGTADLDMFRDTGIRSVQSTPLVSRDGALVGAISTHWRTPHQPSRRRLELFDILARQASDLIERKRSELEILAAQDSLRASAASDAFRLKLTETLRPLTEPIEIQAAGSRLLAEHLDTERASYAELDPTGKEFIVAGDFHADGLASLAGRYPVHLFESAFDGSSTPGRATAVSDVLADSTRTADEQAAYSALGVRAYAAVAMLRSGRLIGGFAAQQSTPRTWTPEELALVEETATRIRTAVDQARAEQALKEADRRKDEFLAILAHELRNPLAPVRNAAHYLKLMHLTDPDVRRPIEMIDRQVSQMARLVDDLLDISRITRGVVELQFERLDVAEVIREVVEAFQGEIESRGHTLEVSLPEESVILKADRHRLAQVFGNLIANAAKYTPNGGRIRLDASVGDGILEVIVEDNGIGIPPAKLAEVFELFVQVDRSLERQGGLGIGLTLARQLVELHHGTIEARSAGPGQGSSFIVRLPIAVAAPQTSPPPASTRAVDPRRILVVDDNQDAAESLALVLESAGHMARFATDGMSALVQGASFLPDIAFLDIGMPRMNGFELARRIRLEPWGRSVHLVALTGWGQETDRRRSEAAGFDAHVVKPASPDSITSVLREFETSLPPHQAV